MRFFAFVLAAFRLLLQVEEKRLSHRMTGIRPIRQEATAPAGGYNDPHTDLLPVVPELERRMIPPRRCLPLRSKS